MADVDYIYPPSAATTKGLPFVTVGPAGSKYPYNGTDIGTQINAAGAALKLATGGTGGTMYISGGIGTVYNVATQVVFYNGLNYIGDNVTLKNTNLLNPFTTDTANSYYSCSISGLNLDGNNVAGCTGFTVVSAMRSTFTDVQVQNCNAPQTSVSVTASPFTYTNPSGTTGIFVQYYDSPTSTTSAIVVNSVSMKCLFGVGLGYGTFYVPPSASIVVTYTTTGANPVMNVANGIGWYLTTSNAITGPPFSLAKTCAANHFISCSAETCSIGVVVAGTASPQIEVTDNVFEGMVIHSANNCCWIWMNNHDSNTILQLQLLMIGNGSTAMIYGALAPASQNIEYADRIYAMSLDVASGGVAQNGIIINANNAPGLRIDEWEPSPNLSTMGLTPAYSVTASYGVGGGGHTWYHICGIQAPYGIDAMGGVNQSTFTLISYVQTPILNALPWPLEWYVGAGAVTAITITNRAGVVLDQKVTATTWATVPYWHGIVLPGESITVTSTTNPTTFDSKIVG